VVDEDGVWAFEKGFEGWSECKEEDGWFCDGVGGFDELLDEGSYSEDKLIEYVAGIEFLDSVDIYGVVLGTLVGEISVLK
jgi:hypothetical protein